MEDYQERREEEEAKLTNKLTDDRNKQSQDKAAGEEMRERAMEWLAPTKKRNGKHEPRKKGLKSNGTFNFLKESTERECKLRHDEAEVKKNQEEATTKGNSASITHTAARSATVTDAATATTVHANDVQQPASTIRGNYSTT